VTNRQRRAKVLAAMEERLLEIWPDEKLPAGNFDDLEAVAVRAGDRFTQELMESVLAGALELPQSERPERCPKCGRALQYSRAKKAVSTIRGPVTFERDYGCCRGCRKGFFPRGRDLPPAATSGE